MEGRRPVLVVSPNSSCWIEALFSVGSVEAGAEERESGAFAVVVVVATVVRVPVFAYSKKLELRRDFFLGVLLGTI